jgi:hypothetical protein
MISLRTLRELYEHELEACGPRCERWVVLELEKLIGRGMGERGVPFRVRCLRCRERGVAQLRPPMSKHSTSNGWIMPTPV